ncbi:hypothetical protein V1525DRAFT_390548, partial [Lipomyces kononenkoae]
MSTLTIRDAFWAVLPFLPSDNVVYRQFQSNTPSTMGEDAPKALIEQSIIVLLDLARNRIPSRGIALQEHMPQVEITHFLSTEADVIRASVLPAPCGMQQGAGCRTDVIWEYQDSRQSIKVAVLEFKNTAVLHHSEFLKAMTSESSAKAKRDQAYGKPNLSFLEGNAYWVSKQAKKYSRNANIPDVAVFDWNAMVIFDFSGLREDALNPVLARCTFFKEVVNNAVTQ